MKVFPDNILRRMDKADRPDGNAGLTAVEATDKYLAGEEKKLQRDCANLLRQRGIKFFQMPYGRKVPNGWAGFPDFTIMCPRRLLFIECKVGRNGLSSDQQEFFAALPSGDSVAHFKVMDLNTLRTLLDSETK